MTHENTGPVVVGVDGGPGSAGALRYGAAKALRHGTELRLVHVSPTYPPMSPMMPALPVEIARAGTEILDRARAEVAELAPDLDVTTTRHTGPRISELVAAGDGARMLVIGRESRTPVERLLGGGTTAAVAAHATVPVVVVPAEWSPSTEAAPVVVGLKSEAHAEELLGVAFARAAEVGAPLEVVHAWRLPDPYIDRIEVRLEGEEWQRRGTDLVEKVLAPWRADFPDVPVTVTVRHADPAPALVERAADAGLLLLVRRPPRRLLGSHLGGTARAVLRAAAGPVEIVPASAGLTDAPGLTLEESGGLLR